MTLNERITQAAEFGKEAFGRGVLRVPALDVNMTGMFKGLQPRQALPILDAWLRAWDTANFLD